jgi:hypothetical protein
MIIMGRVARLIFVVVVSVCVVFCILCCLQNNPVFLSVTKCHILKNENYELCFLANFFVNQITTGKITTGKKRYSKGLYGMVDPTIERIQETFALSDFAPWEWG